MLSFRSLFSRKPKEPKATSHSSAGWRLFGKTAAREGDTSKDLASTPTAEQVGSLNTHNHIIIILLLLRPGCLICSQPQSVLYKGMKLSWVSHLSRNMSCYVGKSDKQWKVEALGLRNCGRGVKRAPQAQ